MNPDFPQNERVKLEAKLTALLLGELHADEMATLSEAMGKDPKLAALYERLKATVELVREGAMQPRAEEQAPLKLSAEKREKLLASFKTVKPKELAKPRRMMDWLVPLAACVAIVGVLAAMLLPSLAGTKRRARVGRPQTDQLASMDYTKAPSAPNTLTITRGRQGEYLATNAAVASRSLAGGPIEGATNAAAVAANTEAFQRLNGADSFGKDAVVNSGALTLGETVTGSSKVAVRRAYIVPPSSSDGLLTSGLRTPNRASEIVQAENRKSEIVLPAVQNSVLTTRLNQEATTPIALSDAGHFSDNGGFGGDGGLGGRVNSEPALMPRAQRASGGKQAEMAAAANAPTSLGVEQSRSPLETATVKVDPNTFYKVLQNVGTINFGVATNAASETSRTPTVATVDSGMSGNGRGFRYVTGVETTSETQLAVSNFLNAVGVNLDPAKGKSVFYNDREGTLTVRGTEDDLELVQQAINTLNVAPPEVTLKTKFAEVNSNDNRALGYDWYLGNYVNGPGAVVASGGTMPAAQAPRSTNWWNTTPTARAFYDDNLNSRVEPSNVHSASIVGYVNVSNFTNATTNRIAEYASAKEELDTAKKLREAIAMKTAQESTDVNLPRDRMVTIMDHATPASTEKPTLGEKIKETFTGKVERTARIQVSADKPDIGGPGSLDTGYDPYFLLTEFATIQSDAVLSRAVEKLKLDGGDKSKTQEAEAKLKKSLDLRPVKNTKFIEVGAYGEKPEEAARIANAVAEAYRDYRSQQYEDLKNHGIKSLQEQAAEQDKKIQVAQAKVDVLAKELSAIDPTRGAPIASAQQTDTALPKPAVLPPTPQPEVLTRENAVSTFSLNVSDVSFKLAAASLEKGQMPEPASIRSEEFINAFDYRDPEAAPGVPIAFAAERARYPFAHNRELLRFSLKTAAAGRQAGRPLNIVLLLDNSGSMERADRVSIIREALRVLAKQLQASDTFSIVTFARTAQLRVDGIPGSQAAAAAEEIAKLTPEGGTNLGEALDLAYETALHHYLANGDNRVVLLTDGAANLGDVNPEVLKQKVEAQRQQGVALDCFGIGWEGYNDDLLEVLTRNGDGRYGFINTPEESASGFAAQLAWALHVAAEDVKVQVEFNPKRVTAYRQIGYAKLQLKKEEFRDNSVAAAAIGAAESGNALYAIEVNPNGEGALGTVRVRYKVPGTADYQEHSWEVPYTGSSVAL